MINTCFFLGLLLIPIWPMKAVSTRDAIGSAVNASAAGKAILAISKPSSSNLKTDLIHQRKSNFKFILDHIKENRNFTEKMIT